RAVPDPGALPRPAERLLPDPAHGAADGRGAAARPDRGVPGAGRERRRGVRRRLGAGRVNAPRPGPPRPGPPRPGPPRPGPRQPGPEQSESNQSGVDRSGVDRSGPASFAEVLRRRRMVRHYRPEPVPAETVDRIVDAGRRSPTAGF